MSHWTYKGKQIKETTDLPEDSFGFVYLITNKMTGQKYIGKKQLISRRRKPLTKAQKLSGRKRRSVVFKESDWKTYKSSSTQLKKDIKSLGEENFSFEILMCGKTKGQCNYLEMYFQFMLHTALDPLFYNESVGSGKFRNVKDGEFLKEEINKNIQLN